MVQQTQKFASKVAGLTAVTLLVLSGCEAPQPGGPATSQHAAGGPYQGSWKGAQAHLTAGVGECPPEVGLQLAVNGKNADVTVRHQKTSNTVSGAIEGKGQLKARGKTDTFGTLVADGQLSPTGRGQVRLTTYQPACSIVADVVRKGPERETDPER